MSAPRLYTVPVLVRVVAQDDVEAFARTYATVVAPAAFGGPSGRTGGVVSCYPWAGDAIGPAAVRPRERVARPLEPGDMLITRASDWRYRAGGIDPDDPLYDTRRLPDHPPLPPMECWPEDLWPGGNSLGRGTRPGR
jgi:hypothetical protein